MLSEYAEHVEALKMYALVTDLHFEAYLPLQTATIAYDVVKTIFDKDKDKKKELRFNKHFANEIISNLEKNCLEVCDH